MNRKVGLTLKIIAAVLLNDAIDGMAQVLMKKGLAAPSAGLPLSPAGIVSFVQANAGSALMWLGIFFYAFNFFLWIVILSKVDLSIAVPLSSVSYLIIPLFGVFLLGEKLGMMRAAGIAFIVAGIWCLSRSEASSEMKAQVSAP